VSAIQIRGLEEVRDLLDILPDNLFEVTKKAFTDTVLKTQKEVIDNVTGGPLYTRTGSLRRSIRTATVPDKPATRKPMCALKKSVVIPARLGMRKAALDEVDPLMRTLELELLRDLL